MTSLVVKMASAELKAGGDDNWYTETFRPSTSADENQKAASETPRSADHDRLSNLSDPGSNEPDRLGEAADDCQTWLKG
jgi:hypothetical protein